MNSLVRRTYLLAAGLLWTLSCAAEPVLEAPEEVAQGNYLAVSFAAAGMTDGYKVELRAPAGDKISSNAVFGPDLQDRYAAVLGIPHDAPPGRYMAVLLDPAGNIESSTELAIVSREYDTETISLNTSMSELRQTDDPRRVLESQVLWQTLITIRADSVFHSGVFLRPLEEFTVTSRFGDIRQFVYTDGGTDNSVHSGIDLYAPAGTPVLSSGNGRVVFSGERLITGNTVVIEHLPGVFSLYYHLSSVSVQEDDTVEAGQKIGSVGSTGLVTGAHLHWEFRIGGVPVDPDAMARFVLPGN